MISALAFLATGLGFLGLAALTAVLGWARGQARLLAAALTLHGLWAVSVAIASPVSWIAEPYLHFARALAWMVFFAGLTTTRAHRTDSASSTPEDTAGTHAGRRTWTVVGLLAGIFLGLTTLAWAGVPGVWQFVAALQLVAGVFVLALIAGVLRNSDEAARWHLKFLCFPLAALFAYELFLDAQLLGLGVWSQELLEVQALLNLVAVPVMALGVLRARLWQRQLQISHRGALYSTALIASGLYLLVVAAVAVALGGLAPAYRLPVQVAFLFLTVLALLAVLTSGAVRAGAKHFIARNFFTRKYDYLHEWQRLLATLADDRSGAPLETRLIEAIANLVEAPGGALYTYDPGAGTEARPRLAGSWNFRPASPPALHPADFETSMPSREGPAAPQPLDQAALETRAPEVWLAVPLVRGATLVGFVALPRPRAARTIDAEDRALIVMAAQHCAGQLAEQRMAQASAETRQFERFSRHYAFVVHDIKNIVSQLALLLKNFERHGHDPEFRADMTETVAHAVGRLEALTARIQGLKSGLDEEDLTPTPLAELLQTRVHSLNREGGSSVELHVDPAASELTARLPHARFTAVIDHLIANAREAVADPAAERSGAPVRVELGASETAAVIDVVDRGCGMSPSFVDQELFKPFRSTKSGGLGMGAYQCRELARELGGDLEALSTPGAGTTMRLSVPYLRAAPSAPPSHDEPLETAS
ncbi:XrtA/PEP-CTERM system histidine kinase PrsK [Rhodovibrio salinarum]|uniref:histidine kinase n=1 Tax=Rhodovibrio salinarum TaxID=1087 RepID=A0A934QFK1_9PROT|nr:XrtA/PEP-CTERM system histidine kinase PrsK [Rhodovibrio salinarum]MBK1696051.1 PEP-CTERM system histidine kinase PrsK [Rhodovibrio salinarum]